MERRVSFSKGELIVIVKTIHSINISGADAYLVGNLLGKVYKALDSIEADEKKQPTDSKKPGAAEPTKDK